MPRKLLGRAAPVVCCAAFGFIGYRVGWALQGRPYLAAGALTLAIASGGIAWWLNRTTTSIAGLQWGVLLVLVAGALVSSLMAVLLGDQKWDALLLNLGTEMAGAAATYFLLERVIGARERQEAEERALEEKKASLIRQMGSDVRDVAVPATDELRRLGWLRDGSLQGAVLVKANLSRAGLWQANLSGAILFSATLTGANLRGANLRWADLTGASVTDAQLARAKSLEGAMMPDGTEHE